jgi:hypothetical protein
MGNDGSFGPIVINSRFKFVSTGRLSFLAEMADRVRPLLPIGLTEAWIS